MSDTTQPPEDLLRLISAATANFKLTAAMCEIAEWDRASPINGVDAADVIASLRDPFDRPIPETRPCILRVIPLDVVLCVQRCIFETNAPIYSDADVQRVLRWMRETLLPDMLAKPMRVYKALQKALQARLTSAIAEEIDAGEPEEDEPDLRPVAPAAEVGMFDFVKNLPTSE